MPTISVIVPVYKVEAYLNRCVDSILSQTFSDFELILVDDGSSDNCPAICDEYARKDSRVRVIHQKNGGLSAARNAGIDWVFANSNSDWITFVDSDDGLAQYSLERLIAETERHQTDISIGKFVRFYDGFPEEKKSACSQVKVISGREACYALYGDDAVTYTTAWAKLYKAELFRDIRYPVGRIHEDEATTYKVLYKASKVAVLDEKLYYYRDNPDGIMNTRFSVKRFDAVWAFEERILFFRNRGEEELAELGEKMLPLSLAKMNIMAVRVNAQNEVPVKYRMTVTKALRTIRENVPDDNYTYYLAMVHPEWLWPHAYLRKIKKMLHIPCK